MFRQWLFIVSKKDARRIKDILNTQLSDGAIGQVTTGLLENDEAGIVESIEVKSGADLATVAVFLGDADDLDRGPYDGNCWIIVKGHPWWRLRRNKLLLRLCSILEQVSITPVDT